MAPTVRTIAECSSVLSVRAPHGPLSIFAPPVQDEGGIALSSLTWTSGSSCDG
jgi:hypothetical protein